MPRWDIETARARERPIVLTVACAPELAARCHSAAALLGAIVKEAEAIGEAVKIATKLRPHLVVVPEPLFLHYQADFTALATEIDGASVAVPSDDIPQADLEKLFFDAFVAVAKKRSGEAPAAT